MILTVVHGDIEDAEQEETLTSLRRALDYACSRIVGTNDTTSWTLRVSVLPADAAAILDAARLVYPWWRVRVE